MKILVRLSSDLAIKSPQVRARFMARLIQNIESGFAAAQVQARVERAWSRLYIETESPEALAVLAQVYGISSFSPVDHECSADLATIVQTCEAAYKDTVAGKSFAVRARRQGDYGYTSVDMAREVGAALRPYAREVNLRKPEVEIAIEVRDGRAYLFSRSLRGVMGLPLGVSGHGLCLLSGGFDSAVAAWFVQKRGVRLDYVFCNLAGAAYERSVLAVARFMATTWSHGTRPYLHVLDFQAVADEIRRKVRPSYAQVILKRVFYRAAEAVARDIRAEALVTGECIAQVSSQTLQNLIAIEAVSNIPVLRPLTGFDKEEITAVARRIGSFVLSSGIQEYCQLVPDKPVTSCRIEKADEQEAKLDPAVLQGALHTRRVIALKELRDADLNAPYIFVDEIPASATVIDCREMDFYQAWHYPEALNIELHELLTSYRRLDKSRLYVLYCPVGLQSAVAAELMQKAGYQAYSLRGGIRRLREIFSQ